MPRPVRVHQLSDLSNEECENEILIETKLNTELHIIAKEGETIIQLPFGNRFDIIEGRIVIYERR